jgi:RNA polymerase sigma factor (sigma-70 family)
LRRKMVVGCCFHSSLRFGFCLLPASAIIIRPMTASQSHRTSAARFEATRWTIVMNAAGGNDAAASQKALDELVRAYWFPLYTFIRRQGSSPHQAEDLTQGFFAHLLEQKALANVERSKGRFRSFMLASLKNFMADEHDKARALKRGGGRSSISLDTAQAEAHYPRELADTMTPERLFEHSWAIAVLNQVVQRLEKEYASRGKQAEFELLRYELDGQAGRGAYGDYAKRLGVPEGNIRVMAHRMRQRYRELLRQEILQTVADPGLVDEEIKYLLECL